MALAHLVDGGGVQGLAGVLIHHGQALLLVEGDDHWDPFGVGLAPFGPAQIRRCYLQGESPTRRRRWVASRQGVVTRPGGEFGAVVKAMFHGLSSAALKRLS